MSKIIKQEFGKIEIDKEMKERILGEIIEKKKKNNKRIWVPIASFSAVALSAIAIFLGININKNDIAQENEVIPQHFFNEYRMFGNGLEKFDLAFLKLENNESNMVYSPLSIKYALEMLSEGSKGNTKKQIDDVIGDYVSRKYTNSQNMAFVNAFFVRESIRNKILPDYITRVKDKYNADVVFDPFKSVSTINNYVSNNTLSHINNLVDNLSNVDFALINALAIDMSWNKTIQPLDQQYWVNYYYEDYEKVVYDINTVGYAKLDFNDFMAKSVEFGAVANKYDLVKTIGEKNIRKTIKEAYEKWLNEHPENTELRLCSSGCKYYETIDSYIDDYIKIVDKYYKDVSSSTDFMFYDNEEVKVFAKDLKTYNNTTLEYVAIQPKSVDLKSYISDIDSQKLNTIIENLKSISLNSFEEGYITQINGIVPVFKYDYNLELKKDLQELGISDIFSSKNADLTNFSEVNETYIEKLIHKANIEFSNEGIKAAAATLIGGFGNDNETIFEYKFDVPVKTIDLTFNKPYMFLIRDKDSGETWFVGTVYEPIEYSRR